MPQFSKFALALALCVIPALVQAQTISPTPGSGSSGTVSSVGLALPSSILTVSGSPVTASGTLTGTLATQTANTVFSGPTTGSAAQPTFRALVAADLPSGTGTVTSITAGTGILPSTNPCTATCTLNTTVTNNAQTGTSYAIASTDGGKIVSANNSGAQAYTIVVASTSGFGAGFGFDLDCIGAGTVTLTATTSTFDNGLTTLTCKQGQDYFIWSDGTNYHTFLSPPSMATNTLLGNAGTAGYPTAQAVGTGGLAALATNTGSAGAFAVNNTANVFSGQQSNSITTLSISTATFTPDGSNNNYKITLIHASCPCTLANPSATPVAGTAGVIEVIQSSTGSDVISTWGSQYIYAGGTSTIAFSTGANAEDFLSYYVIDSTHILLTTAGLNASH